MFGLICLIGFGGFCRQVSQYKVPHLFAASLRLSHTCWHFCLWFWLVGCCFNVELVGFGWFYSVYSYISVKTYSSFTETYGFGWFWLVNVVG